MWLQRSHITWLKEGDRNTKYFHRQAQWRARKNHIQRLRMDDGSWCHDQKEMKGMTVDYFQQLFTADVSVDPQVIVDLIETSVTDEANADLCREYSDEEFGDALFRIGPLKAPDPDGLRSRFFQRN